MAMVVGRPVGKWVILMPLVVPVDQVGLRSDDLGWSAGSECGKKCSNILYWPLSGWNHCGFDKAFGSGFGSGLGEESTRKMEVMKRRTSFAIIDDWIWIDCSLSTCFIIIKFSSSNHLRFHISTFDWISVKKFMHLIILENHLMPQACHKVRYTE